MHDNVALFNSLNMSLLVREVDYARSTWIRFANKIKQYRTERDIFSILVPQATWPTVYRYTMILAGDARALSVSDLECLDGSFPEETVLSATSGREITVFDEEAYTVRPTLAGWYEKSCSGFLISDSIRKRSAGNLFVYGPMQELFKAPGLPLIRVATALVQLGVAPENAWRITERVRGGGVLYGRA